MFLLNLPDIVGRLRVKNKKTLMFLFVSREQNQNIDQCFADIREKKQKTLMLLLVSMEESQKTLMLLSKHDD